MAENKSTETVTEEAKPKQIAVRVDADLYAKLEDIRWDVRANRMSDLVIQALQEFATKHGTVKP